MSSGLYLGTDASLGDRLLMVEHQPARSHLVQPPVPKAPVTVVVDLSGRLTALETRVRDLEQAIDRLRWWARGWRYLLSWWQQFQIRRDG